MWNWRDDGDGSDQAGRRHRSQARLEGLDKSEGGDPAPCLSHQPARGSSTSSLWPPASGRPPRLAFVAAVEPLDRTQQLASFERLVSGCTRCALAKGRTQVVFGSGNPDAELLFVGEAPGFHEDQQGFPFVGQAGKLLDKLLAGIGLDRSHVYICNVLKCRPPGNRDPQPEEIEACESHLFRQVELIQPRVVATLGNFATKLLSGKPLGITRVHGQEQWTTLGGNRVLLYPLYHPAAALYTPRMLQVLEEDFARIPALLGGDQTPKPMLEIVPPPAPATQLDLF
jgi:uracil-DNA glycosylase family 4